MLILNIVKIIELLYGLYLHRPYEKWQGGDIYCKDTEPLYQYLYVLTCITFFRYHAFIACYKYSMACPVT